VSSNMTGEETTLIEAFVADLGVVVEAMLGASVTVQAGTPEGAAAWIVRVAAHGAVTKTIAVSFARAQAARLSARVMMMEEDPGDNEVTDMLKELVAQAVGAVSLKPAATGTTLRVLPAVDSAADPLVVLNSPTFDLIVDADLTVKVSCGLEAAMEEAVPDLKGSTAAAATTGPVAAAAAALAGAARSGELPENLDVILDIDLPLSVRFGNAELTIDALTKLGPGSLIELSRMPDDPVELLVNGKLVARGEVVVVGGNYGVRVHEVVSAADRIRTLE
jgi:flagellar motor switch protein FliN